MQNINYCQSCKIGEKTREINILGKPITVKNYICSADGINYKEKPENIKLQLFVNMLTFCPANCRFCVAKNTKQDKKIDIDKFKSVMKLLKAEDRIRGIKITGGEPFYDIELLNEVISAIYDIFGYQMEVAISTNGTGLENLKKIKDLEHIETIHLSRHHYDDNVNRELFGNIKNIPDKELLKDIIGSVSYKDIFVLNSRRAKSSFKAVKLFSRFLSSASSGISCKSSKRALLSSKFLDKFL